MEAWWPVHHTLVIALARVWAIVKTSLGSGRFPCRPANWSQGLGARLRA
jgi:hypothetical protein